MSQKTKFTQDDLDDWESYEKVRQSGQWNMFFPQARIATGLSRKRYSFVIQNFSELKKAVEERNKTK